MSTIDYQQTAIWAIADALHGDACPADPDPGESCGCGDYEREAEIALTAALPHLRAEWEQELAEKIRAEAEKIRVAQLAANKGYLPLTIVALLGGYGQAAALLEGGAE